MKPRGKTQKIPLAKRPASLILLVVTLCLISTAAGASTGFVSSAIGLRSGLSLRGEEIEQYDIFFARELPWTRTHTSGWRLESSGELTASLLHREEEDGLSTSLSLDLSLLSPDRRFSLGSGGGAGLLEDYVLGEYDFGGPIFFLFHAGFRLQLHPRVSLGYRYSHQSNGHIYNKNPSLNLHQLELQFSF